MTHPQGDCPNCGITHFAWSAHEKFSKAKKIEKLGFVLVTILYGALSVGLFYILESRIITESLVTDPFKQQISVLIVVTVMGILWYHVIKNIFDIFGGYAVRSQQSSNSVSTN